ncbi:hypothetical protein [Nocardioides sp. YIM 152315]|uniref:hypothetical protein n=1 Tax=Nocardioides sp. YIM 152315 TaxID=3031760 RepID=UPI0023DB9856|nr:hypothetical protein [Nocardioides sp. YIM 152315]MDF1602259.1 hypothetical protein [Nocardioides sp. YIM 152315]
MSTRQRYDCAESMIGAGFGGTVLGALARSVFVDGLRWLWIAEDPSTRRPSLLGDLLAERSRICATLRKTDSTCGNLSRWLMPLPNIADLTGESKTWLDAPPIPDEPALLDHYLTQPVSETTSGNRARELLDLAGLRGAVSVLQHAGHGNFLGLQSTMTADGVPGHDLRPDHEALFMHVAAAGIAATLLGTAAAVPELWPPDVDRPWFLDEALRLAAVVAAAARPLHGLSTSKPFIGLPKPPPSPTVTGIVEPGAVLQADDLLPDVNTTTAVAAAAEEFFALARSFEVDLWRNGPPTLHMALTFTGAHSHLQAVMSTYDQPGSAVIAAFASRMLLEEAARHAWRHQDGDGAAFVSRATQYFDEYRHMEKKTIALLSSNGVPIKVAKALFALPDIVRMPPVPPSAKKGRQKLPSITSMLGDFGKPFAEPGWLTVAYSLLSQITHATPIGLMHNIRWAGETWQANDMSPEMLGLTLDVACLSSVELIGTSAVVLTGGDRSAMAYRDALLRSAMRVHRAGQLVHGLD